MLCFFFWPHYNLVISFPRAAVFLVQIIISMSTPPRAAVFFLGYIIISSSLFPRCCAFPPCSDYNLVIALPHATVCFFGPHYYLVVFQMCIFCRHYNLVYLPALFACIIILSLCFPRPFFPLHYNPIVISICWIKIPLFYLLVGWCFRTPNYNSLRGW